MTTYKVVVDGSNVATEGRTTPSLSQLDEAVRGFIEEHPGADVLVIVDSSFPNRIDPKDLPIFESAYNAGEIITPPAGTIGRGDSFILKVADKLGATVFSNDSFQEFHGTYDWLFEKGRLVGGKPIPGLGWVFTPRTPVRGPKSREAVREAKRTLVRIGSPEAMKPMPVPKAPPTFMAPKSSPGNESRADANDRDDSGRGRRRGNARVVSGDVVSAADRAAGERSGGKKRRRRGRREVGVVETNLEPINDAISFLSFVASHKVATEVEGLVDSYSSHGFYVMVGSARCYVQLAGISSPAPRSAKEVVRRGESRPFVVVSFDSTRRGIELALPGTAAALAALAASQSSVQAPIDDHDPAMGSQPGVTTSVASKPATPRKSKKGARTVEAVELSGATADASPPITPGTKVKRAPLTTPASPASPRKAAAMKASSTKAAAKAAPATPAKVPVKARPVKAKVKPASPNVKPSSTGTRRGPSATTPSAVPAKVPTPKASTKPVAPKAAVKVAEMATSLPKAPLVKTAPAKAAVTSKVDTRKTVASPKPASKTVPSVLAPVPSVAGKAAKSPKSSKATPATTKASTTVSTKATTKAKASTKATTKAKASTKASTKAPGESAAKPLTSATKAPAKRRAVAKPTSPQNG